MPNLSLSRMLILIALILILVLLFSGLGSWITLDSPNIPSSTRWLISLLFVLSAGLVLGSLLWLNHHLSTNLRALDGRLRQLSKGDLSATPLPMTQSL